MEKGKIAVNNLALMDEVKLRDLFPFVTEDTKQWLRENLEWIWEDTIVFYGYSLPEHFRLRADEKSTQKEKEQIILVSFGTEYFRIDECGEEELKRKVRETLTKQEELEKMFSPEIDGWTKIEAAKREIYENERQSEIIWLEQDREIVEKLAKAYVDCVNGIVNDTMVKNEVIKYAPFTFTN